VATIGLLWPQSPDPVATRRYHDHVAVTPARHIRVSDDLWDAARCCAESEGENITAVIVSSLKSYVDMVEAESAAASAAPAARPAAPPLILPPGHAVAPEPPVRRQPEPCPHPKARILKGLCGNCGTYVG
jgi:hypothetical protein